MNQTLVHTTDQPIEAFDTVARLSLYFLLIFTPLARGSVQPWAQVVLLMVVVVGLAAHLMGRSLAWDWRRVKTPLDMPIAAGLWLILISLLASVHRGISLKATALLLAYLAVFYLVVHTTDTRDRLKWLVYIVIGVALFLSVFGIFKWFGLNPFPWWEYSELNRQDDFLAATYGNHNHLAGYLEMALPLLLGLFFYGYSWSRVGVMLCISFLLIVAQVLSLSRGGWIATSMALAFMAAVLMVDIRFRFRKRLIATIGVAAFSALLILASTPVVERMRSIIELEKNANFHGRVAAWEGVYELVGAYPLLGTGPGTFEDVFTQYQPPGIAMRYKKAHNDYLQFVSDLGLLAVPLMIWLVLFTYKRGFEKLDEDSRLIRGVTLGTLTGITAILVHSSIDFNLRIPANALLFTVLVALAVMPSPHRSSG